MNGGGSRCISHLHPSYSALHYVLLFPKGEDGWHPNIPSHPGPQGNMRSENVSECCYHAYRLHPRPGLQPPLFWGGELLQQYVVDTWASTEQNNLNWIRHHQKELRADLYKGLADAVHGDGDNGVDF
jgi:hypothetical protein